MPEKTPSAPKKIEKTPSAPKKIEVPGKRLAKIPLDILLSPGGILLLFFALIMEALDLIPFGSLTWELAIEILFMIFLSIIAKVSFRSMILPFIIERVPAVSDIVPSWLIRMFV